MAARNIAVRFGDLLNLPMKMEGAVEKKPDMSNLCVGQPGKAEHDATPVKAPRVCGECGPIVDPSALVKGVKQGKAYTIVSQDDIADAKEKYAGQYKGEIVLVAHPAEEFLAATAPGDSLYYLTPAAASSEGQYQTFVKFLGEHPELAFVGLYTPVSATSLYRVTVRGGVLVMEQRARSQALKPLPSVGGEPLGKFEKFLEIELEDNLVPYDADRYEDTYGAALAELVEKGETVTVDAGPAKPVRVAMTDAELMEKLGKLKEVA